MKRIGTMMMEARKKVLLTQRQAASRAGLSLRTLTNLETGAVEPDIVTLYKLSAVYGLDFEQVQKVAFQDVIERREWRRSYQCEGSKP